MKKRPNIPENKMKKRPDTKTKWRKDLIRKQNEEEKT